MEWSWKKDTGDIFLLLFCVSLFLGGIVVIIETNTTQDYGEITHQDYENITTLLGASLVIISLLSGALILDEADMVNCKLWIIIVILVIGLIIVASLLIWFPCDWYLQYQSMNSSSIPELYKTKCWEGYG